MKNIIYFVLILSIIVIVSVGCIAVGWTTYETLQGVVFVFLLAVIVLFIGVICGLLPVIGQIVYWFGTSKVILPNLLADFEIASTWVTDLLFWLGLLVSIGISYLVIQVLDWSGKEKIERKKGKRVYVAKEVGSLLSMGEEDAIRGDWHQSLSFYQDALDRAKWLDKEGELFAYQGIGQTYQLMQDYDSALKWYQKAVQLAEEIDIPVAIAFIYDAIGSICDDPRKAIEWHEKSIPIKEKWTDKWVIALGYIYIGDNYQKLQEYDKALQYCNKAKSILQQEAQQLNLDLTIPLPEIAEQYKSWYDMEMRLYRTPGGLLTDENINVRFALALSNNSIGLIYQRLGLFDEALSAFQQSLAFISGLRVSPEIKRQTHLNIGLLYFYDYKNYSKAYSHLKKAIEFMEEINSNIKVEDTQMQYLVGKEDVYGIMVLTCLSLKKYDEAVSYVERGKSRVLLNMLSNARLNLDDADKALVDRKRELEQLVTKLQFEPSGNMTISNFRQLDAKRKNPSEQMKQYTEELARINQEIKNSSKEWRTMQFVPPVDFETLRKQIHNGSVGTTERPLLIEYFVVADVVIAFLIPAYNGPPSLTIQPIAWNQEISQEWLQTFHEKLHPSAPQKPDKETKNDLSTLYMMLIFPILKIIQAWQSTQQPTILHFSPHKFLHALPLHAAYDETRQRFLIEDYPIAYTPAASLLHFWQTPEKRRRTLESDALVFGNPTGDLPQTEIEAKAVAEMWQVQPYLREAARKALLIDADSSAVVDKGVLHLSCHGVFDFENPILTHLRLANHERLDLNEILSLPLEQANLVVLSACQSAVGKQGGGDELIGLTRSFLYAGTPSVIASLWNVNDESTRELMISFYRHWRDRKMNKARALQQAQIDYLRRHRDEPQKQSKKARFRHYHPYYWASFVLVGDWL